MGGPLNRRTVLQSGAFAAGAFAFGGTIWNSPASAGPVASDLSPPITGRLVAWLVIDAERGASMRLAELDAGHASREIAAVTLPACSVTAAGAEADAQAVLAAAQAWRVPPAECVIGRGRIVHPASKRSVPYAVWIDFA